MSTQARTRCEICNGSNWLRYPDPSPSRSLLSDFRVLDAPLSKYGCRSCGTAKRDPIEDDNAFFSTYELYAHDAGDRFESARQQQYAAWLANELGSPASAFEGGAGNGSLQLALRESWPAASLSGVEPSGSAVSRALAAGAVVEHGFVGDAGTPAQRCDVAFAVNVIEHVANPITFVRSLASHSRSQVAIVCPDGSEPWSELLFADHLRSLSPSAVRRIFCEAGLKVESQTDAPPGLGKFIMTVGRKTEGAVEPGKAPVDTDVHGKRARYLQSWAELDDSLLLRAGGMPLVCFGTGEAAALLRAYAPRTWSAVSLCTIDGGATRFGALRVLPYGNTAPARMLLGVTPTDQERLAARVAGDGHEPIRWDDLIAA